MLNQNADSIQLPYHNIPEIDLIDFQFLGLRKIA